jgi:hypothetical protein
MDDAPDLTPLIPGREPPPQRDRLFIPMRLRAAGRAGLHADPFTPFLEAEHVNSTGDAERDGAPSPREPDPRHPRL